MSRQQSILVVDDQDVIIEFITLLLLDAGYVVTTATNGMTAIQRFQEVEPDLVVTDVSMPGMDGWQLVQVIRSLPRGNSIPVILMSAGTRLPFSEEDLDAQTTFLQKPFSIEALLDSVERMLQTPSS
jgi:CheY-like chemotaxis protein